MQTMKNMKLLERFNSEFRRSNPGRSGRGGRHTLAQLFPGYAPLAAPFLRRRSDGTAFLVVIFALLYSGCAGVSNPLLSFGPHPRVEDCAIVQQATPTRYVCDGKTYTSVQLDQISEGEEVQLSEQAAQGAFPGHAINPTGNFGTYRQGGAPGPGVR